MYSIMLNHGTKHMYSKARLPGFGPWIYHLTSLCLNSTSVTTLGKKLPFSDYCII